MNWLGLDKDVTYLVDTDVLEHIRFRADSDHIYTGIIAMAKAGIVKTVRQVFGELKKHKQAYEILHPHEKMLVVSPTIQFCAGVQAVIQLLETVAPNLYETFGGKNPDPADPWLVAVSKFHGYCLVTDESPHSAIKLPAVCKKKEIDCVVRSGPHFLIEVGLVKKIEPEHLSAQAFFGFGQKPGM